MTQTRTQKTQLQKQHHKRKRLAWWTGIVVLLIAASGAIFHQQITDFYDEITLKPSQKLNVPLENQMPDLPNGCEVTSLSMLLNYYGIQTDKTELSTKIKHVSSYSKDGNYRGNPHRGFVGYMSIANAGWCVYNEPLYNLAKRYTARAENATGTDFIRILKLVSDGHPVLIITTLKFAPVTDMQTWDTKQGQVKVTPSSHACVITGFNKKKKIVYVNDPYGIKNKAVSWSKLEASYNQQGKQAIYIK